MGIFLRFFLVLYVLMKKFDCGIKGWILFMKKLYLVENRVLIGLVKVFLVVGVDMIEIYRCYS